MILWDRKQFPEMCEGLLQLAVAQYVQWWRCFVVPNLCLFHEMDVAVLTRAGCLWEFEIKVSQRDWEADRKKDERDNHWRVRRNLSHVERFYYVVTPDLVAPDWLPDWAGILVARVSEWSGEDYIQLVPKRRAKSRRVPKPSEHHRQAIYTAAHRRFWDRVMRLPTATAVKLLNESAGAA